MITKQQHRDEPTLREAVSHLAGLLENALETRRPTRRGRKSDLAGDLYVRGVAEAIGITVTHMSRIITGRSRPGMELATRIANFADCTMEDILAVSKARHREDSPDNVQPVITLQAPELHTQMGAGSDILRQK